MAQKISDDYLGIHTEDMGRAVATARVVFAEVHGVL